MNVQEFELDQFFSSLLISTNVRNNQLDRNISMTTSFNIEFKEDNIYIILNQYG
jgi:hypothetical protein